jgi:hypothetical protein
MRGGAFMAFMAFMTAWGVCGALSAPSVGSPASRQFELVSPVYKGGFGATHIEAVAPDGNSIAFYSPGVFADAPSGFSGLDTFAYLARRGEASWSTMPMMPPDVLMPYVVDRDVSTSLDSTFALGKPGPNVEGVDLGGTEEEFLLHPTGVSDVTGNWELGGTLLETLAKDPITLYYAGGSGNLCHLLFESAGHHKTGNGALLAEAIGTTEQIYELVRGCSGAPVSLRLLALNNQDKVISAQCKVDVGVEVYNATAHSAFNAIAAGGNEIFFTTCIKNFFVHHQLFVRLSGERTLEVSKPFSEECTEIPCPTSLERPNADFVGASEDGSRVYFTTTAALTGKSEDLSSNLYLSSIGCPEGEPECSVAHRAVTSLTQVSRDPNEEAADVQGVVRVAPDGSRVYFVAGGDLLNEGRRQELEGAKLPVPHAGAENLYAYDSTLKQVAFIGDLCSGSESSGMADDLRCPTETGVDTELWSNETPEAQTAGVDGRFLLFSTYAQLVASDTDTAKDIYRYDAETGVINRVSIGERGYDANGNNNAFDATIPPSHRGGHVVLQHEMSGRAISEDGSRVIFKTVDPLSPSATNHLSNGYEWHTEDGYVSSMSLISSGSANTPVEDLVMAPEGNDVFIVTTQGLVPQDVDGAPDVYDARLNGGFPPSSMPREPCEGDACQGPLSNPVPLLVPGSVLQVPEGSHAVSHKAVKHLIPKKTRSKAKKRKRRGIAAHRAHRANNRARRGGR